LRRLTVVKIIERVTSLGAATAMAIKVKTTKER